MTSRGTEGFADLPEAVEHGGFRRRNEGRAQADLGARQSAPASRGVAELESRTPPSTSDRRRACRLTRSPLHISLRRACGRLKPAGANAGTAACAPFLLNAGDLLIQKRRRDDPVVEVAEVELFV